MMRPLRLLLFGLLVLEIQAGLVLAGDKPQPAIVLVNPSEEARLSLRIWLDKGAYEAGEALKIRFIISHDCYVYIYNISTEGKVSLLFPNAFQRENFLPAGQYNLPNERYSFVVEGRPGLEYLQAIASLRPIELLVPPEGAYKEAPFPPIGLAPEELKAEVVQDLSPREWAAAWTSFYLLEPGRAWLTITSEPSGAAVYLNGRLAGSTPLALSARPGYVRVLLEKEGFVSWSERVYLARNEIKEINARLSEAPPPPSQPSPISPREPGALLPGLGLSLGLGLDWESLGLEVGLLRLLWLGTAARFTADRVPDYYEVEPPGEPWPGELVYNAGPEMEAYLKLELPFRERLALTIGAGFAVQEQVHIATPASGGLLAQDVTIKPNGYRTAQNYLTILGGLILKGEPLSWELAYHNRRGWLIGAEIEF